MTSSERVWYASYGSNLLSERFGYYLSGGAMDSHALGHHGARDASPPSADRSWRIPHRLAFGGDSKRWQGGGVAFVDPEPGSGEAVARIWHLTPEQFDDVAAQENGLAPGELSVDIEAVVAAGWLDLTDRWYRRVLYCGDLEGPPGVTFTVAEPREPSPPGPSYLSTVGKGLLECGLSIDDAVDYLMSAAGVAQGWTPAQIQLHIG